MKPNHLVLTLAPTLAAGAAAAGPSWRTQDHVVRAAAVPPREQASPRVVVTGRRPSAARAAARP